MPREIDSLAELERLQEQRGDLFDDPLTDVEIAHDIETETPEDFDDRQVESLAELAELDDDDRDDDGDGDTVDSLAELEDYYDDEDRDFEDVDVDCGADYQGE